MPQPISLPRPSDKWIPYYFVGFFVLLISVLVPMAIIAVSTNSGVVTEHSYEKGLAYNQAITAAEQQQALGWRGELTSTQNADGKTRMDFVLTDATGNGLDKGNVTLVMIRPTQAGMDQKVAMEALSNGHYSATLILPAKGLWEAQISVMLGDKNFQIAKRFTLP